MLHACSTTSPRLELYVPCWFVLLCSSLTVPPTLAVPTPTIFLSPHSRRRRPLLNSSHFRSYAATATIALSGPPSPRMLVNKAVKMLYTLAARKQDVQLKTPTLRPLWRTCDNSQSSTFYRPCGTNVCHTIACADDKHCQITCALLAPR